LIWNNWTKTFAGGSGELPSGVDNKDFLRCNACHGWDALGPNGGYVRRSGYPEKTSRPKPAAGTNLTKYIGKITSKMVKYEKGRELSVEDNRMPNFTQTGGLTEQQVADVVAFLNNG
jgi:mono/diheme cytochrome c family protein